METANVCTCNTDANILYYIIYGLRAHSNKSNTPFYKPNISVPKIIPPGMFYVIGWFPQKGKTQGVKLIICNY